MSRYDKLKNASKKANTAQADTGSVRSDSEAKWKNVEHAQKVREKYYDDMYRAHVKYPNQDYREGTTAAEDNRNNNRINQVASQKKWVKESEKRPHARNRNDSGKSGSVKAGKSLGRTKPSNR